MTLSRELAAIMFTDIIGYTALMERDERKAYDVIKLNTTLHQSIVAEFRGRLIKELGDGILSSFPTVSDALNAAIKIQQHCKSRNTFKVRIGVHYGEVVVEGGDVFGDAVNIASRIQSLGIAGSVLFSKKVADEIKNKVEFSTVSIGQFNFKNVVEAIEVFALTNPGFSVPRRNRMTGNLKKNFQNRNLAIGFAASLSLAAILMGYLWFGNRQPKSEEIGRSIAVLPFENLSGDAEQEYFSDGMTEEIINSLAQVKELKVTGRTSSFQFKGKHPDLKEVGAKLGVENILEGSVRRQNDQLRITIQLISVKDGYHLWSERFDRKRSDAFALQEEIANRVTEKLKVSLMGNYSHNLSKHEPDQEAYDLYLKGRYFWNARELLESEKYFTQAANMDTSYAAAYAGLAETYVLLPYFHLAPPLESLAKSVAAAQKAIQLDSTFGIPYAVIAYGKHSYEWNSGEAKRYYVKALRLSPNYAPAHYWYGQYLTAYGSDIDEVIGEMRKSVALEPLGSIAYFNLGIALTYGRRYEEALASLKMSSDLNKQNEFAYLFEGHCYFFGFHQLDKAKDAYEKAADLSNPLARAFLIYFSIKEGKTAIASAQFAEILSRARSEYVSPFSIALAASYMGNKDLAHDYFVRAIKEHDNWVLFFKIYPENYFVKNLMSDPRNDELIKLLPNRKY